MHNVLYLPHSTGAILAPRAARNCPLLTCLNTWPCDYPLSSQPIDKQLDRPSFVEQILLAENRLPYVPPG